MFTSCYLTTAIELLAKRVWYKIQAFRSGDAPPEISTARSSPFAKLPTEIVEVIIVHLIYDTPSLIACSLTCYSWYITTVPHLHHTLVTPITRWMLNKQFTWPKPLPHMHRLGLLPLVKKFHVRSRRPNSYLNGFTPQLFNYFILYRFTALTNVQELGIDYLDLPKFMPRIRRYFGHFLPTVRSLALRAPKGSRRQIIYFIGLFQHLEDLKLIYYLDDSQDEPVDDLTLIPVSTPPLRGRLTMISFTRVKLLKDMIDLFGGVRFRHMDLCNVAGMRLLLDTCAKTLETLRLYPSDPRGEGVSLEGVQALTNTLVATTSLRDFDLSRNKSLRTLEIPASSIYSDPSFLTHVLSTIAPATSLEVIVLYRDYNFRVVNPAWLGPHLYRPVSKDAMTKEGLWHCGLFEVFRKMHEIRNFRLVLCIDGWDGVGEYTVQVLKQVIAKERTQRVFDDVFPEPLVVHSPRGRSGRENLEHLTADCPYPWIPL